VKPSNLKELVARDIKHESGHAKAKEFCDDQHRDGTQPTARGDKINLEKFQRQQNDDDRDSEYCKREIRRQIVNQQRKPDFDLAPGNEIDDARNNRREVILQPRFKKEEKRQGDPKWTKKPRRISAVRATTLRVHRRR